MAISSRLGADEGVRTRLLVAATRLFADRGFDATSIQAVADEVGVAKPSLLYHFPSKEDLRDAVLDELLVHWKDVLPRVLMAATSGKNRFEGAIAEVISFFERDTSRARLLLRESIDRPSAVRERLAAHLAPWVSLVIDYIRQGQTSGRVWPDLDPEAYVHEVSVLVVASFAAEQVGDAVIPGARRERRERRVREMVRMARASMFMPRGKASASESDAPRAKRALR